MALQPDGKIIVGGSFTAYSGSYNTNYTRLIRLNANGTYDPSFSSGAGPNNLPSVIRLQQDGKLVMCGLFTTYSGSAYNRIIRLNTNGSIDNTFNVGTGFDTFNFGTPNCMTIDPSGSIYITSTFTSYSGSSNLNYIIKLTTSGSIDNTFNTSDGTNAVEGTGLQAYGSTIIHYTA